MIATVHRLDPANPDALRLAADRIRPVTRGAEDVLHDLGVISITSSASQAMGRIGETVRRTLAVAAKMRTLDAEPSQDDNERVLRYLAELTVNPALAHGMARKIGALTTGRLADIVVWDPAYSEETDDVGQIRRVALGQDLLRSRRLLGAQNATDTATIRVELIHPFPARELGKETARFPTDAEVRWGQSRGRWRSRDPDCSWPRTCSGWRAPSHA